MELTEVEARYLLYIYRRQEEEGERVGTSSLAQQMGVKPPTSNEVLQRLARRGLLHYTRYLGFRLTLKGRRKARELLRCHRLLETLLCRMLGCSSSEACMEASRLDLHLSSKLARMICRVLGHPRTCPCGKPIQEEAGCR
ncbi:MAG: metal-dependent transcriptional regulator [Candidatus Hadarchaeales archaeon]